MSTIDSGHSGDCVARRTKRLWTDEEKRSICFQTTAPSVSVAQVARRYAVNPRKATEACGPVEFGEIEGPEGLSDILCVRPVSSLADEPFAEDDGELGFGLEPLARRPFPFLGGVVQDQI